MEYNYIIATILLVIFPIGLIGNLIVLMVLQRQRNKWSASTSWLFNLALADMIFLCTMPFWAYTYIKDFDWYFGLGMCKLVPPVTSINMFASILFLTAMSIDRWGAVAYALQSSQYRSRTVVRFVCLAIWCAAILLSIPRFMYQQLNSHHLPKIQANSTLSPTASSIGRSIGYNTSSNYFSGRVTTYQSEDVMHVDGQDVKICSFYVQHDLTQGTILLLNAVIGFVIPFFVICICYIKTFYSIKRTMISKREQQDRIAKLFIAIIAAFFICWLPCQILNVYSAFTRYWGIFPFAASTYHKLYSPALCLAWTNSCINPILYAFVGKGFQEIVKSLCCKSTQALTSKFTTTTNDMRETTTALISRQNNIEMQRFNEVAFKDCK